jgi:sugar lactone lactonase YvrE
MKMKFTRGRAALLLAFGLLFLPLAARAQSAETLVLFDAAKLETPESLVFDRAGNVYVSLALTGEIRKITPQGIPSTFAQLPVGAPLTPCGAFVGLMGALAIDNHDNLYVTAAFCDLNNRGVWKVTPDGQASLIAHLPAEALPNGITFHHNTLYIADSALGRVWAVPAAGGTPSVWIQDDLLFAPPGSPFPGANGIKAYHGDLYVSVSGAGTIVAIPFLHNDFAGSPRVHATVPAPQGCDDFSFDVHGSLYCVTDPFRTLIRVDPGGSSEILLTFADGLDGPTATAFGVHGQDRFNLYITNAAFPFFSVDHRPSLMRLRLDVPGAPLEQ